MASLTLLSRSIGKDVELEENSAEYYDQCPFTMIENSLKAKLGKKSRLFIYVYCLDIVSFTM